MDLSSLKGIEDLQALSDSPACLDFDPGIGPGLVIYPSVLRLNFNPRLLCCSVLQESLFNVDCINPEICFGGHSSGSVASKQRMSH